MKCPFANLIAVFVLGSGFCLAQSSAIVRTIKQDPQAVSVITRALALASMSRSLSAPIDTLSHGTIEFANGSSANITLKSRGTALLHNDVDFGTSQLTYVINAGQGYRVTDGTREDLPLHTTLYQRADTIPMFSRLAEYAGPAANLTYVGLEQLTGGQAHHIQLSNLAVNPQFSEAEALNSEFHAFIDANTYLVVKTKSFLFSPDAIENRFPMETYYSDYGNVNGFMVPFHITRFVLGNKYSDLQLSDVQIGVGLNSDSDFQ